MKYKKTLIVFILFTILFNVIAQQTPTNQTKIDEVKNQTQVKQQQKPLGYTLIQLDKPYKQELSKQKSQKYRINVTQEKVNKLNQSKWFLFIQVQTTQELQWEKTKIQLFSVNSQGTEKPLKQCDSIGGVDSCFLTNANFDYKKQTIQAKITCQQECKFTLSAEISTKYKLTPDTSIELNFQDTAYSKLFSLDTNSFFDFKRLQITLKPKGFLSYSAPVRLYVNKGDNVPTKEKHDYKGMTLWDQGLGVFINYPDGSGLFTILIQGPEKNILTLQTKIIYENKPVATVRYQPYFAFLQAHQTQLFEIEIKKQERTYVKLTTVTGSIEMSNILDMSKQALKMEFSPLSRSYGEIEYKIEPSFYTKNKDANITDKLLIEIKANKDSTLVFESYTNNDEMNYIVPEVNRYADLDKNQSDVYYLKLIEFKENINEKNKQARIEVMTTTYDYIDLKNRFFLCKATQVKDCQPTKEEMLKINSDQSLDSEKRRQLKNFTSDASTTGVKYYDVTVNYADFVQENQAYHIYIIITVTNPSVQEQILYTLQYINLGSTYFLKEKELKRDRLSIDQVKYYTFVNNDKDVKTIKIHSIEISGQILMVGYRQDPRINDLQGKQVYEYHGAVTFMDVKPGEQFYIMAQGVQSAYFSLYLQLIRQSESTPDQKGNNQGYNEIIIQENVKYDFFIKPKENIIIQMHPTVKQFDLYVSSILPLDLCMTENLDKPPFKPNCEIVESLSKSERMGIKMDRGLVGNMGVTNSNDKVVEFKVEIRAVKKQEQCTNSAKGFLNKWSIPASTKQQKKIQCYRFNLNRRQNVEIIVQLLNMQYENATIQWQLNDKEKQIMMSSRHMIWGKELIKVCGESQLQKCDLTIHIESNYSTDAFGVVQYLDQDLILLDGMAQPSFMPPKSSEPKYFRYQLLNDVNTTIILENKNGFYKFFGKIVSRGDYLKSEKLTAYPTKEDHIFQSDNPFYYLYQTYLLTEQMIKNSTCQQSCILLLSVFPTQGDNGLQQMGRFTIQVSQQDRYLKQNQPSMGYLSRNSIAFYEYYNPKQGTIYIQVSNQNMNCAKIYVKKGNESRATPSSYDKFTDKENTLIYEDAPQGAFSITLEAKHFGCSYTIHAVSSIAKISRIKRGTFTDKTMEVNQTRHFLYEHFKDESFKILTLNKIGQVMIKLKVLYEGELNSLLTAQTPQDLQKYISGLTYQQSNIDFLKVHHKKSLFFCFNCTYLISVTANKYTETSLIIPSKDVELPIVSDALIKDEVKEKQVTKFRIFTSNIAQFKLYVQYGSINVTIKESVTNKLVHNKVYNETKEPIYEKFNASTTKTDDLGFGYDFVHYSLITIEGIANSSFYSFELLSTKDEQKSGGNVKYGIPEYFFLEAKKKKCFKGTIDDQTEEFILSFDDASIQTVKKMSINCSVNEKEVKYNTNYGVSEMTLEINDLKITQPSTYEICLSSDEMLSLTFIQSAHIMMVPSDTSILLTHPTNLTFGSKGTVIMQVDDCGSDRSVISISSSFNDLHTAQSEISQIRRGNNLIEFNYWGPVYIHIWTPGTRFRWRNKDIYKESGLGYEKYAASSATAYKQGSKIKIEAKPLQQIAHYGKNTTQKIIGISYKIMLAKNEKQLLNSLSCNEKDVLKYEYQTEQLKSSVVATFEINDDMKKKFADEKFFLAGVIANINIQVNKVIQNYRFIYPMVDIQKQVLFGGEIKPVDQNISRDDRQTSSQQSESLSYLVIAFGIIIFFVALMFVYKKFLRRWLRSRKQKLSDQGSSSFKYTEFASMRD